MDVLNSILSSLRLNGGIVFDGHSTGDWCLIAQFEPEHCAPYFPVPRDIIAYHYVRTGRLFAQIPGQAAVEVLPGSIVLFPRNEAHLLYTRPGLDPVDVAEFVRPGSNGALNSITMDFGEGETDFYCGWLGVPGGAHPLLAALPPMLLIQGDSAMSDWTASSLHIAAHEWNDNPAMVARMSELLFAQAVRRYAETAPEGTWLAALRDPVMARALVAIHARYAQDIDIDTLAREAGVSRTVLGERFVRRLGEPPIRYLARWRLQVAANHLLEGREPTATIAHRVGFGSEAAFNRAFKRQYGEPPATWKRRMETARSLEPV